MVCIMESNMALHIDHQQILCYHMETYRSIMIGHSCFHSPDYLVVQGWIRAALLYPTNIQLAGVNIHC